MLHGSSDYRAIADDPEIPRILGIHEPAYHATRPTYAVYHEQGTRTDVGSGYWVDTASVLYHYTIEGLRHQIIVTDTRTWRSFPRPGDLSPSDLIAESELAMQINATPDLGGRTLFVVLTTNLVPSPGIRQGARDLAPLAMALAGEKLFDQVPKVASLAHEDFLDSWEIERADFGRAIAALSRKFPVDGAGRQGRIIVLSGDVHSASATRLQYWAEWQLGDLQTAPDPAVLVLAQLIGSPLHNQSSDTIGQHESGYRYTLSAAEPVTEGVVLTEGFVGWNPRIVGAGWPVGRYHVQGLLENGERPLHFDPEQAIYTLRDQRIFNKFDRHITAIEYPPHFRYLLEYLKASDAGRVGLQAPLLPPATAIERHAAAMRAWQNYAMSLGGRGGIVGRSNIGEIKVITGSAPAVSYLVRWQEGAEVLWVRFDVPLDMNDPDRRPPRHDSEPLP